MMLNLVNLRIEISTIFKNSIFETNFKNGLNIIHSDGNTAGKSSIISAIYYALGLEEIIGGRGPNVLSSAFKSKIKLDKTEYNVLESKIYLEITNGKENITLYRMGKSDTRKHNLVTVIYSPLISIDENDTKQEDMYVHVQKSATNTKGFHKFLEEFLELKLPLVPSKQDEERKLYLQLVFSALFIEQKRGWGDIFSGMPYFDIPDQRKRVIEYILDLDSLEIEKKKSKLKKDKFEIEQQWKELYNELLAEVKLFNLQLTGIHNNAEIIDSKSLKVLYYENGKSPLLIEDYIESLNEQLVEIIQNGFIKKKENSLLLEETSEIKKEILEIQYSMNEIFEQINNERLSLQGLEKSLNLIEVDIENNKDARKIRNYGSNEDIKILKDTCPTCEQPIKDTVILSQNTLQLMSIDENIKHLETQKNLFDLTINQKKETITGLKEAEESYKNQLNKLYLLLQIANNDLFSLSGSYSEKTILKKVELEKLIFDLTNLLDTIENKNNLFLDLSEKLQTYMDEYANLPKDTTSRKDQNKLNYLRTAFINYLNAFGYKSTIDFDGVQISTDTYMPMVEKFDMKFDSSASDNIRRIWAFVLALFETSSEFDGNHPRILIFDEPGQHSIVVQDLETFITTLNDLTNVQVITGITVKEQATKRVLQNAIKDKAHSIDLASDAFN